MMAHFNIPYAPRYPEVHQALEQKRFVVLVAHRRFGKTVLAINHLLKSAYLCKRINGHFGYVAPFRNQAKSVAWDYLRHYSAPIRGRKINESELAITIPSLGGGAKVRIFGADNPDALRGMYFDAIVLDEVAQMKPDVWEEIIQPALADRHGKALFIGTPKGANLFSDLYHHALANDGEWQALCYPVDKTRALPQEEVERLRIELTDNKFRQEMLCDFTASADDILISLDEVRTALDRSWDEDLAMAWPLVLGVDIARYGEDATVFFPRRGNVALAPIVLRKKSNVDIAGRLAAYISEHKPFYVNIDQGQGTGVIDLVQDLCRGSGTSINEVPFGAKALRDKYVNRRAEMWDQIRQWLGNGSLGPCVKYAKYLLAELTAPRYDFDHAGRIRLESKDNIKKRLRHSTDLGDALALTFALPVNASPEGALGRYASSLAKLNRKERGLYDPFRS